MRIVCICRGLCSTLTKYLKDVKFIKFYATDQVCNFTFGLKRGQVIGLLMNFTPYRVMLHACMVAVRPTAIGV